MFNDEVILRCAWYISILGERWYFYSPQMGAPWRWARQASIRLGWSQRSRAKV